MSVDPGLPRRMSRVLHHIDDLFKLQSNANDTLSEIGSRQLRLSARVDEVQQALDVHGGRLGRIEDRQRHQSQKLDGLAAQLREILTALRSPGSNG